jgi:hypothetical protein
MHHNARAWLRRGDLGELRDRLDLLEVLAGRAWAGCTCQLWVRIQAVLA